MKLFCITLEIIRFASKFDEKLLHSFYCEAYSENHILNNTNHHNWQFKNNPFKKKSTIAIAINKNEISSHFGLIPIPLKVFNEVKSACWFVSVFTLKRHRKKGLADKIIKFISKSYDSVVVLSYSKEILRIYLKNNFISYGNLNRYIGIINTKKLSKFTKQKIPEKKLEIKDSLKINRIYKLGNEYDSFWKDVKNQFPITVNRTKEYLTWRYFEHPLIDYHFMTLIKNNDLVGYGVIKFEGNKNELKICRIVDMIVKKEFEEDFIQQIINYCFNQADLIDFFCTGNFYHESLIKKGFFNDLELNFNIPMVFNPIDMERRNSINFVFKNINLPLNKKQENNSNLWYFVKGDSDQDRAF